MKLYFARHGQTDSNARAINRPNAGNEEPLNEQGIQQAHTLAEELKDVEFDIIISSPLKRCTQTAEIINRYHNADINIDDAWQEIRTNGYVDINTWNDLFDFSTETAAENAETLQEFFRRIYDVLGALIEEHDKKTVLIVSHGGVQHALYAYANKLPLQGNMRISPMRNCEYRIYDL